MGRLGQAKEKGSAWQENILAAVQQSLSDKTAVFPLTVTGGLFRGWNLLEAFLAPCRAVIPPARLLTLNTCKIPVKKHWKAERGGGTLWNGELPVRFLRTGVACWPGLFFKLLRFMLLHLFSLTKWALQPAALIAILLVTRLFYRVWGRKKKKAYSHRQSLSQVCLITTSCSLLFHVSPKIFCSASIYCMWELFAEGNLPPVVGMNLTQFLFRLAKA